MKLNKVRRLDRYPHIKRALAVWFVLVLFPICALAYDVHLSVPFKAQVPPGTWKNTRNCGQTSVLMVTSFYNGTSAGEQGIKDIDDWLLTRFGDPIRDYNGSYTDIDKLAVLAREFFGFVDASSHRNWTLADLRSELSLGHPVIVAVWTNMNSGSNADGTKNVPHFMVLVGMNDNIVYVNDPGHTHGSDNQYDLSQFETVWATQHHAVVVIPPSTTSSSGLVAYYPFNGNSDDQSGRGNNGTAFGGVNYVPGRIGQAANFNGSTSYISVSDNPSLRLNQFTLAAWINPSAILGGNRILEKGSSNSYYLDVNPNGKALVGFYDGVFRDLISPITLQTNTWYYVAGTYDGTSLKLYINGSLINSAGLSSAPFQTTQPLIIGWKFNGIVADHFAGLIDEVRIYNRALSQSDIQELYNLAPLQVELLSFQEGNPKTTGDGVLVNSAGGTFNDDFDLSTPYSLAGTVDGLTVSIYPSAPVAFNYGPAVILSNLNTAGPCAASLSAGGPSASLNISSNGVTGRAAFLSQDLLQTWVNILNQAYPGCNITLNDLYIERIAFNSNMIGQSVTSVDAVAIGRGPNNILGTISP